MTFLGRGVLLECHLPVSELRSQRNSNPRNARQQRPSPFSKLSRGVSRRHLLARLQTLARNVILAPRELFASPKVDELCSKPP